MLQSPLPERAPRLQYLDGLRALAAVYVVMFHAVLGFAGFQLTGRWRLFRGAMAFGHEAVAVFIVLSGYCLMLPVVHGQGRDPSTAFVAYLGRRARRILPPYFVALALTLGSIALVPALAQPHTGTIWDDSLPAFSSGPILAHVLLVHNWLPAFSYRINGPLWSVATEWQIYFFFPLLLVPLWRRFGISATFLLAAALGYAPLLLIPEAAMTAIPWYLALFTLGMAAAEANFSPAATALKSRAFFGNVWASGVLWALCLAVGLGAPRLWFRFKPITDLLVGAATAALLVYLTERVKARSGKANLLLSVLESRPAQLVGHFSYSLYLTHLPVVALVYFSLQPLALSAPALACSTLIGSLVASLVVAYPFHLLIERPFMHAKSAGAPRPAA